MEDNKAVESEIVGIFIAVEPDGIYQTFRLPQIDYYLKEKSTLRFNELSLFTTKAELLASL